MSGQRDGGTLSFSCESVKIVDLVEKAEDYVSVDAPREPEEGSGSAPGLEDFSQEEQAVLARVGTVLRRISFGTVSLVVQDGRVVQIEMAEKFRLR
jgi:hypothetical protein